MDTQTIDRHGIGGNQPPLDERLELDHADLLKRAAEKEALVPAEIKDIETDEEAAGYTEAASDIKAVIAEADGAFTAEKAPWLSGGRTVDNFFDFRKDLGAAVKRVVEKLNAYQDKKLAAKRKTDAEAAEKARKEAALFDEPVPVAAPVVAKEAVRVVTSTGAKASGSLKWLPRVVDIEKVPRQYLLVNESLLKSAVAGLKAQGGKIEDAKIPGVEIYEAIQTSIR